MLFLNNRIVPNKHIILTLNLKSFIILKTDTTTIPMYRLKVNLFKITSLTCSPRLICGGVKKLHYESHDSDHMLRTLQMAIW
jgi:hypothetical protein